MKAAIYARYSSDNQREESIDAQIRAIKEFAKNNNIQIVKVYTDEARTATTDDRPQFLQMIKDSEFNLFNAIVVHKLDRFARNRYDSAFYKKKLKDNRVKIISVLEHLDDSPESIILESVLEGMAEYYSKNLSREVMKGMKETALQCKHTGGTPPLGYDVNPDKTYSINEKESKTVQMIFQMYADGFGYTQIVDELNKHGYKTKNGIPFAQNSFHSILNNEKYTGTFIFNRSWKKVNGKRNSHKMKPEDEIIKIKDGMPRIISDELWDKVREKMIKNKVTKGANTAKSIYLLAGKIKCGDCGHAMIGHRRHSGRNKTLYETYECSRRKRSRDCIMKGVRKDLVESIVIDSLYNNLFSNSAIEEAATKILEFTKKQSEVINADIEIFEKELKEIDKQLNNMAEAIANGFYNSAMKAKSEELESRRNTLIIRLNEAEREAALNTPNIDMIKQYLRKDSDIKTKSPEDQKQVIQTYIRDVIVYEDKITTNTIVSFIGGGEPYLIKETIDISDYRHCR